MAKSFPLTQSKSGPDRKCIKQFTIRVQSRINKILHIPDPVQSKPSSVLISALQSAVHDKSGAKRNF